MNENEIMEMIAAVGAANRRSDAAGSAVAETMAWLSRRNRRRRRAGRAAWAAAALALSAALLALFAVVLPDPLCGYVAGTGPAHYGEVCEGILCTMSKIPAA
jgi:hypothetical protein